jgi:hypothetical protein
MPSPRKPPSKAGKDTAAPDSHPYGTIALMFAADIPWDKHGGYHLVGLDPDGLKRLDRVGALLQAFASDVGVTIHKNYVLIYDASPRRAGLLLSYKRGPTGVPLSALFEWLLHRVVSDQLDGQNRDCFVPTACDHYVEVIEKRARTFLTSYGGKKVGSLFELIVSGQKVAEFSGKFAPAVRDTPTPPIKTMVRATIEEAGRATGLAHLAIVECCGPWKPGRNAIAVSFDTGRLLKKMVGSNCDDKLYDIELLVGQDASGKPFQQVFSIALSSEKDARRLGFWT